MKKQIGLLCGILLSLSTVAQQYTSRPEMATIIELLNSKDSSGILALMSDSARIGNLPPTNNSKAVPEILSKFSSITHYEVTSDIPAPNGNHLVSLSVTYQDGRSGKPTFLFNKDGKLTNLGIIKAQLKGNPEVAIAQAMALAAKPDTMRVHFQMKKGLIYVPALLNGKDGFFMFDSGAPVVILKKKYVSEERINKDVSVDLTGMGGIMQGVQWSTGNTLEWGNIQLEGLDAPVSDMGDMEIGNDIPVFGLMGFGVLKGYQITFDYRKQQLLLERVDENGKLTGASFKKENSKGKTSMRMKRHIPIVDIALGGKLYPMGIDCGANANVLQEELAMELASFIDYEEENVSIVGVGGVQQSNRVAFLMQAKLDSVALQDMYTVFTNQAIGGFKGADELPIVGLLGTPFLNQFKTTFNYEKGEITFY